MKISYREGQVEHPELIGTTQVSVEPHDSRVDQAIQVIAQKRPDLLKNITVVRTDLNKNVYGEYNSSTPNTIYLNLKKIEESVRNNMQGQSDEAIEKEITNQISLTAVHESGHQTAYTSSKNTSEQPAEEQERQFRQMLPK